MTEQDIDIKWAQILTLSKHIMGRETMFSIRVRLNPHHPQEHIAQEKAAFMKEQVAYFTQLKSDYVQAREFLVRRMDNDNHEEKREFIDMMDKLISDDMERIMLT